MIKNNFDTSSTGIDIELSCFRDCHLSRMYFEESIEMIQHSSHSKSCIAFYTDNGQIDDSSLTDYKVKGLKADLKRFLAEYFGGYIYKNKLEMQEEIINDLPVSGNDLKYYNSILEPFNCSIEYVNDIRSISVTGYSQGDYATVLCDFTALEKLWGTAPKEDDLQKYLNRLFYDAPIYARFDIDGKEYNYNDYVVDDMDYEWDADKFAAGVSKDSGVPVETLKEFLPEYPEYH